MDSFFYSTFYNLLPSFSFFMFILSQFWPVRASENQLVCLSYMSQQTWGMSLHPYTVSALGPPSTLPVPDLDMKLPILVLFPSPPRWVMVFRTRNILIFTGRSHLLGSFGRQNQIFFFLNNVFRLTPFSPTPQDPSSLFPFYMHLPPPTLRTPSICFSLALSYNTHSFRITTPIATLKNLLSQSQDFLDHSFMALD